MLNSNTRDVVRQITSCKVNLRKHFYYQNKYSLGLKKYEKFSPKWFTLSNNSAANTYSFMKARKHGYHISNVNGQKLLIWCGQNGQKWNTNYSKEVYIWLITFRRLLCVWLYVLIMSRRRFRANPHSIVAWMSRNSLLEASTKSKV